MPMLIILHVSDYEDHYRSPIIEKHPPSTKYPLVQKKCVLDQQRTGQRKGGITVTEVGDIFLFKDKNYNEVYGHKSNPAMPIINYNSKLTRH